jgi:hypothetical protein
LQKQIKNAAAHIIDRKVLYNLIENFQIAENFELAKQDQNVEVKKEDNAIDQAEINVEVEQDVELKPVSLTNASEAPIIPEKVELSASLEEMPDINVEFEITIEPDNIATAAEKNIEDEKLQNDDWQQEEKPIEFIPPVEKITGFAAIVEAEIPLEREIKLALAETIYLQEFEQNSGHKIDLLTPIEKEEIAVKTEEKVESEVEKEVQVLHHQQTTDFVAWLKNLQLNESNNVNPSQAKPQNEGEKLIDAFIEKPIQRAKLVKQEFYSPVNMAKQSVSDNDFFVTETLAKIYIKQGNLAKAIKVYQNLSLKNPEKNNIFATQIKILKEQLHNKTGK